MELVRKKVAVTGGSSGIGKAVAKQLVAQGCDVAILARDPGRLEAARAEIAAAGPGRCVAVSVDVTDEAAVARAADAVIAQLGGLDALILNQGYARCAPTWDAPMSDFHQLMETNYFGHVRVVKAFVDHFRKQRSGAICLVTSMLGFMSFYGYGAYSASKHAIVGFASALRQELLPYGVEVTVFYPPTTDTPGLAEENETKPALTWAIEGTSRKFTPEQVAAELLKGVRRHRFENMIGVDSWAIFYLTRWAPGIVRRVLDGTLWKHVRTAGLPG